MSDFLQPHELQHARLPCPSRSPWVCSNSCLLSQWCHLTISFFVSLFCFIQLFPRKFYTLKQIWGSVELLSCVQLFATSWTAGHRASLSITSSRSLLKLISIESVMPSNDLILCNPLLLLPSIFPQIRVFSKESVLHIRWPKYWSFSFSINPFNEYSGLISFICKLSVISFIIAL